MGSGRDRVIELVWVSATELLANPRSWRTHPERQRIALKEGLERIGFADVCLARRTPRGLELIDGHLRRELSTGLIPTVVLDVTQAEADSLLLSLDPLAAMATANAGALADLLATAIAPEEILEELQCQHLRSFRALIAPDPDEIPSTRRRVRVHAGDLWQMQGHRLICADATEPSSLERLMQGEHAEIVWTDPPYGVDYVGKTAEALTIKGDTERDIEALLDGVFGAVGLVLSPGAAIYVCHPAGALTPKFYAAFERQGWRVRQTLIWVKDRMVLGRGDYHYRHEPILFGYAPGRSRGRGRGGWYGGNDQDSVLEVDRPATSRDHPTAKPVELIRRCLRNSSKVGAVVLDPFAGSGSTLIAAEELGRRALLVEIDPTYCDVIIRRWERLTGQEAVRGDG